MVLKKKTIRVGNRTSKVELAKEGAEYIVKIDGDVYKKTANELFAVQAFNEI